MVEGMYMCDVEVMWLRECTCVMWRLWLQHEPSTFTHMETFECLAHTV